MPAWGPVDYLVRSLGLLGEPDTLDEVANQALLNREQADQLLDLVYGVWESLPWKAPEWWRQRRNPRQPSDPETFAEEVRRLMRKEGQAEPDAVLRLSILVRALFRMQSNSQAQGSRPSQPRRSASP